MTMKDEEWKVLDRKALGTIRLCLALSVTFNILKEKTTEGVMSTFVKLYEKPLTSNKVFLMKHLFIMNISEGGSIVECLNEFNTITSHISDPYGDRFLPIYSTVSKQLSIVTVS